MSSRPSRTIALSFAAILAVWSAAGCNAVSSSMSRLRGREPSAPSAKAPPALPPGGERLPPVPRTSAELPLPSPAGEVVGATAPPIPNIIETTASREPSLPNLPAPTPTSVRAQDPVPPPAQVELPPEAPILVPKQATPEQGGPRDDQIRAVVLEAMTKPEPAPKPKEPPTPKPAVPDQVKPAPPKVEAPPPSPDQVWRETLDRLRTLARTRASESPGGKDGDWTLRHRVLSWMAEPSGAGEEWASGDGLNSWRILLDALKITATRPPGSEPKAAPAEAKTLREAVRSLEARVPFEITELALCRKVTGFGEFETMTPPSRSPGQPVVIYAELEGLSAEPVEQGFRSRLSSRVELLHDAQSAPVWSRDLGTAEDRCRRRRRDFYVNNRFNLPDSIKPGEYRLRLTQTDLVSGKSAGREVPLTITP